MDDEEDYVRTMAERLEMRDLGSDVALNGEEALAMLEGDLPDVMVLDSEDAGHRRVGGPRGGEGEIPQVKVIILTGHGSEKEEVEALRLGASAYLQKPVDIQDLMAEVRRAGEDLQEKTVEPLAMTELIPDSPVPAGRPEGEEDSLISERRYRRILLAAVLSVSFVAIAPLIIATAINYLQYQEAFREEQSRPMVRFAANGKLALEAFLEERTAALRFVSRTRTHRSSPTRRRWQRSWRT